jgi:MFS family permease
MNSQVTFIIFICAAEIFSMAGTMFFPALLPGFRIEWGLSNTEAGWINGIFYGGYAASVPILVSLTDRVDSRRIYLYSAAFGAASMAGFGWLAQGTLTAMIFRFCAGISLAGTYMPGLKALSDHITGRGQSRAIAFYTSSYGIGTALSVFLTGWLATWLSWRWAAILLALGCLGSVLIFAFTVRPRKIDLSHKEPVLSTFDFKGVLKNRSAVGYMLGYAVHCWELFGFRTWLVAFLAFSLTFQPGQGFQLSPQNLATIVLLAGVPSSILGNETAQHWERRRVIAVFMLTSGIIGCVIGFTASLPFMIVAALCLIYGIAVMLDSGALTAGIVAAAHDTERGRTLALYAFVGFGMAFLAPLAFGCVLDLSGSGIYGWGFAFAILGLLSASGPLWLRLFRSNS